MYKIKVGVKLRSKLDNKTWNVTRIFKMEKLYREIKRDKVYINFFY